MSSPTDRRAASLLIGTLGSVLLFGSFFANVTRVAHPGWFGRFQANTEALVLGRMVKSRQDGLFSASGFNGWGSANRLPRTFGDAWIGRRAEEFQLRAYVEDLRFQGYCAYLSQAGGQGLLFSVLDRLAPFAPPARLRFLRGVNSLVSAVVLAMLVVWLHRELGVAAALAGLASLLCSQWLIPFGKNLWWCLWAFYLPMVGVLWVLRRGRGSGARGVVGPAAALSLLLLLKFFVNGFEYATTTVVMALVPFAYEQAVAGRDWRPAFLRSLVAGVAAALAVAVAVAALTFQIATLEGSLEAGARHVARSFQKRTYADPDAIGVPAAFRDSLEARTWPVVRTYLDGTYVSVDRWHSARRVASRLGLPQRVSYAFLVGLFFVASVAALLLRRRWVAHDRWRTAVALVAATWFSLLAPLSWFVVFKAHAFVHTHMDHLVWQMPFTILGFAVCGLAARGALLGGRGSGARDGSLADSGSADDPR